MYCSVAEPVEFSSAPVPTPRKKVISSGSNSKTGQKNPHKNIMHITKNQFILTLFSMYSRFAQRNNMAFRIMKCTHKILSFFKFSFTYIGSETNLPEPDPFYTCSWGLRLRATLRILFLLLGSQTVNWIRRPKNQCCWYMYTVYIHTILYLLSSFSANRLPGSRSWK